MATKPVYEDDPSDDVGEEETYPRNKPEAVARPSMTTTAADMYQDYGIKAGRGSAGTSETVKPTASKPAIVTKEELEKSGLSLRDYMNKQKGLTRRDGSTPTPAAKPAAPAKNTSSSSAPDTGDEADRMASRFKKPPLRQETQRERAEAYNRKRGIPGYKSGGSVSSASRRADGIATKGKTRGKFV